MFPALSLTAVLLGLLPRGASAQVEQIWLTHQSGDADRIVVNWTSRKPGNAVVRWGRTPRYGHEAGIDEHTRLHHVEIRREPGTACHYAVRTGRQVSPDAAVRSGPTDVLRAAVVADWHRKPDLSALIGDKPHLLLTAGDNIPNLYGAGGAGNKDSIKAYAELIDRYPGLFRSTPLMPVLGNHDKQMRPRGDRPPARPVYDIEATAFRRFFALPGDEWKWRFAVPAFDVRFVALDLHHISDRGTTWQTCHPFDKQSEQFRWYREVMKERDRRFTVTLYNEQHARVRRQADGAWGTMIGAGTLAITGFGHFAERAEVDGFTYYNTSLSAGDRYPDPQSAFLAVTPGYLLLTITRKPQEMTVEIKDLDGRVLDRKVFR